MSVDFPVDTGKLNLLLNTFLLLLTWQTWIFESDWKQDGWLCIACCLLPEWPAGGGDSCLCAADKIGPSFGFSGHLRLIPVAVPVTLLTILVVRWESCCTPYGTSHSWLHWASFGNRQFISKPSPKCQLQCATVATDCRIIFVIYLPPALGQEMRSSPSWGHSALITLY